jgi:hypothetical protein
MHFQPEPLRTLAEGDEFGFGERAHENLWMPELGDARTLGREDGHLRSHPIPTRTALVMWLPEWPPQSAESSA